jgi:hypothetical protein
MKAVTKYVGKRDSDDDVVVAHGTKPSAAYKALCDPHYVGQARRGNADAPACATSEAPCAYRTAHPRTPAGLSVAGVAANRYWHSLACTRTRWTPLQLLLRAAPLQARHIGDGSTGPTARPSFKGVARRSAEPVELLTVGFR